MARPDGTGRQRVRGGRQVAERVEQNIAAIRRGYAAFNRGDLHTLAEVLTEEVVWHVAGRNPLSGEKRGREACLAYFGQLAELSGGTFRAELHDVVANDTHVVGLHTATGERAGRRLSVHTVLVCHMQDGRIQEAWEHPDDPPAFDAFIR